MNDPRQQAAAARMAMRTPAESRMYQEGQQNAGGLERFDDSGKPYYDQAALTDYPKMLYRKTDKKQFQEWADQLHDKSEERMCINDFGGLLCDTMTVGSLDEEEAAASEGWDTTPRAAHGMADGAVKAVSAKDEENAALREQLAAALAQLAEQKGDDANNADRRGPGRPRKEDATA